jgi:hypothetical protein
MPLRLPLPLLQSLRRHGVWVCAAIKCLRTHRTVMWTAELWAKTMECSACMLLCVDADYGLTTQRGGQGQRAHSRDCEHRWPVLLNCLTQQSALSKFCCFLCHKRKAGPLTHVVRFSGA